MALSRIKTWSAGEVLTASDLNSEFNNILGNALSLISPITGALDLDGNSLTLDAAAATSVVSSTSISWNFTSGAKTGTPATTGSVANWSAQTFTDSATAGSGTATAFAAHAIQRPTLAAANASVSTTDAATLYIANSPAAGTNETITNAWALWVDAGNVRFDSGLTVSGVLTTTGFSVIDAKGDLIVGTAADTGARQAVGSDGQAIHADSSQTSGLVYIDNPSRPILLVNPNWQIDQINEGALYTVNTTDVRTVDGWSGDAVGAGVFKVRRLADPDNAALMCAEISCTTADAAIGATDRYEFWTAIEGLDLISFQLGIASSAQPFTYQFKLKSNAVTGIFGVYFSNSAGNRFYAGTINVSDTSEHEYSVSLTGDLTGTWLYTNGIGLRMGLVLAAGSNFQGTAGAWTASAVKTTSAQANFMSANTNIIYLKRGHVIPGALVQAYRPADIQKELAKAQRHQCKTYDQGTIPGTATSVGATRVGADGATNAYFNWRFPVPMRAIPTATVYSPATGASGNVRDETGAVDVAATFSATYLSSQSAHLLASAAAASRALTLQGFATARLS